MIRVLLADDHAIVRTGLARLLDDQSDMRVVGQIDDGAEVVAAVERHHPDVLVLDLSLPNRTGLTVLHDVRSAHPEVRVVVLSMYPEDAFALHVLDAGASAYVNKARDSDELLTAIRRAHRGLTWEPETLTERRIEAGPHDHRELPHHALSAREYQVFMLVIEGHKVQDVAVELGCSASTAANHVANIKTKLGVTTLTEIVRYASRLGLV